jgi:ATP-binding cassette subfamily B protein
MSRRQRLKEVVPKLGTIYGYFWEYIAPQRRRMAGAMLALILGVFFRLLEPWPLKIFLDHVIGSKAGAAQAEHGWLSQFAALELLLGVAVAMVVIAAARAMADFVSRVGFFVVGNKVVMKVREQLYEHLLRLPVSYHAKSRTGDLIVRVTRDVSLLRDVTATAMLPLVASTFVLVGMLAVMVWLRWQLALLALVTLPLFWLTTLRLGKRIRETARRQRQREGAMATNAAEALGAIRDVKALGLEERFTQLFSQRNKQSQKEDLKASRLSLRLGRTIDVLLSISSALVIWFGGKLVLQGQMSAGDIVVFLTYLKRSFKPAQEFAKYVARLSKAAAAGERIIELLEEPVTIRDADGATPAVSLRGELRVEGLHFEFDAHCPVLRGVDFEVNAGEFLAIVGPSGAGKSTLISQLLRLYEPSAGSIFFDGREIATITASSLRSQLSVVLQDAVLLADSVRENIRCAAPEASDEQVAQAARLAGADEFIRALPDGYDTAVGERGATLSRGQRQRLALARAAVRRGSILLLDEPTTGLDEASEKIFTESLIELTRDRTTLLVTHNLSLACRADRILFLDAGQVAELGSHEVLMARKGQYFQWFHSQQSRAAGGQAKLSIVRGGESCC